MVQRICNLISFIVVCYSLLVCSNAWRCDYYFRYLDELGLSVFANYIFEPFDVFDIGVGVPVPLSLVYSGNELVNYVEGYNSTHALLTLGLGMLLNHNENPTKTNIRKYLSEETPQFIFPSNQEASIDIRFEYSSSISVGDQLFVHYGEEWFEERGMAMIDTKKYLTDPSETSDERLPGCIKQYAHLVDGQLVAKRNLSEGITIEVARSIFLPITPPLQDYRGPFSDILWWLDHFPARPSVAVGVEVESDGTASSTSLSSAGSGGNTGYALLLSGYGAFYGVRPSSDSEKTSGNVKALWEYGSSTSSSTSSALPQLMKFVTSRAVQKGEPLILINGQRDGATRRKRLVS